MEPREVPQPEPFDAETGRRMDELARFLRLDTLPPHKAERLREAIRRLRLAGAGPPHRSLKSQ